MAIVGWPQAPPRIMQEGQYWVQTVEATVDVSEVEGLHVTTWGDLSLQGGEGGMEHLRVRLREGRGQRISRIGESAGDWSVPMDGASLTAAAIVSCITKDVDIPLACRIQSRQVAR